MPSERRTAGITVAQRTQLRDYAKANPRLTQKQLQGWFQSQYQRLVTQPTISESLSAKYSYLDSSNLLVHDKQQRLRVAHWPDLEEALYQWVIRHEADIPISGDLLKRQAGRFWQRLAPYQGMDIPVFSNGWLAGFKQRHGIRGRIRYGEAAGVDEAAIAEQLAAVQAIARQYPPHDCYNCDETGLFYKSLPDRGLGTSRKSGHKADKSRITAHFCCNADGSDKVPIWFIGNAANPRCFGAASVQLSALNCVWRSNGKAWMTSQLMIDWLKWFSRRIGNRRVLLIMDNFSAHTLAVNIINETAPLQNITVVWLPPNSTSKTQPLDQGIISAFKTYYRKRWLTYMVEEFDCGQSPLRTMNVLKAIRWSILAWHSITPVTIQNCWYHSTLILRPDNQSEPLQSDVQLAIDAAAALITQLQQQNRITDAMAIDSFLSPVDELVQDTTDDIAEQIAQQFDQPEPESEDEVIIPKIQHQHAIQLLQQLRAYELQQIDGQYQLIELLEQHEASIKFRKASSSQQSVITSFFT